ncbi:hypothetical protein GCM10027605_57610 [Micromonospora zhanjiangensis]
MAARAPVPRQARPGAVPSCVERCCRLRLDLRPGQVFRVDRRASVQFGGECALLFRLTAVEQRLTCHGWVWLTGYVLSATGEALEKREIFVQLEGLQLIRTRTK